MSSLISPSWLSFRNVLLSSIAIRVALIIYSEWHDAHSVVKYTDVDYRVFTDAAVFLASSGPGNINRAQGPFGTALNVGDPYMRETYRYTPFLAALLTPNKWLHPSFGKYLFALCDILNGVLIYRLLKSEILPRTVAHQKTSPVSQPMLSVNRNPRVALENKVEHLSTLLSALHMLNPLVFSISSRGSSEAVLSLFVLGTLYAALKAEWDLCAVLLGLSTHWKIYPVIYGVGCLGVVADKPGRGGGLREYFKTVVQWKTIRFAFISAGTFVLLGVACYVVWGYPFLYESYLYHVHRLDHRHNFSPYFYQTYLTYPSFDFTAQVSPPLWTRLLRSPLTSFVPQMGLAVGLGLVFGRRKEDLVLTWFLQTTVFVVFNKVCTSQYFLWYLLLLPLLIPQLAMPTWRAASYAAVWVGSQVLWLAEGYKLEFLGQNVFVSLWIRSLIYVVGNCWVIVGIMDSYTSTPTGVTLMEMK